MATGDVTIFDQFLVDVGLEVHQLETDTFKLAFIGNSVTPATTTSDPRWGAGGGTNLSSDEQSGGNFAAGGVTLANNTYALSGGQGVFDADDPSAFSQNGSNPSAIYHGIIYNDTATGKQAVCSIEMGGPVDASAGDVTVTFNASGIITVNQG